VSPSIVSGRVGERVAQVPELAALLAAQHLEVRERRLQHGVPVHEALAAVDEAFVVEPHEYLGHGARQPFVHREAVARPVDGRAEAAELLRDRVARALLPLPDALDEALPAERLPVRALALEQPLDDHLRGDTCVIRAGLPERSPAEHAVVARQRIHDRVLQRVPHVQRARHVRRRNHDAVRLAVAGRREIAGCLPARVVAGLDLGGSVVLVHGRSRGSCASKCSRNV
jgi:hypothetical protein